MKDFSYFKLLPILILSAFFIVGCSSNGDESDIESTYDSDKDVATAQDGVQTDADITQASKAMINLLQGGWTSTSSDDVFFMYGDTIFFENRMEQDTSNIEYGIVMFNGNEMKTQLYKNDKADRVVDQKIKKVDANTVSINNGGEVMTFTRANQ